MENSLQRNDFWDEARKYKFTSSNVHRIVTEPRTKEAKARGELSETTKNYIKEKITEENDGYLANVDTEATVWGVENESKARHFYTKLTNIEVEDVGFLQYNDYYGGSPDGIVYHNGVKGCLEIKCPFISTNHTNHCEIRSVENFKDNIPKYYWQCVSHMIVSDAQFCDFVSFDPRVNKVGFFMFRLHRDENEVQFLLEKLKKAQEFKKEYTNTYFSTKEHYVILYNS
jgi:hypothetical protein